MIDELINYIHNLIISFSIIYTILYNFNSLRRTLIFNYLVPYFKFQTRKIYRII